jgi:hypothetical protein
MRSAESQRKQTRTNPIENSLDYEMGIRAFVIDRHGLIQYSTCSSSDEQKIFFLVANASAKANQPAEGEQRHPN